MEAQRERKRRARERERASESRSDHALCNSITTSRPIQVDIPFITLVALAYDTLPGTVVAMEAVREQQRRAVEEEIATTRRSDHAIRRFHEQNGVGGASRLGRKDTQER